MLVGGWGLPERVVVVLAGSVARTARRRWEVERGAVCGGGRAPEATGGCWVPERGLMKIKMILMKYLRKSGWAPETTGGCWVPEKGLMKMKTHDVDDITEKWWMEIRLKVGQFDDVDHRYRKWDVTVFVLSNSTWHGSKDGISLDARRACTSSSHPRLP